MGKLGRDFILDVTCTKLLKHICMKKGVRRASIIWNADFKDHMKWSASCNIPSNRKNPLMIQYDKSPYGALKKLHDKLYERSV